MSAAELLDAEDPQVAALGLRRYELTHAVVELRKVRPRPANHEPVARAAAQVLLDGHAWQDHARAVALATLLDIGDVQQVVDNLITRLEADQASAGDLLVGGRAIRLLGRHNTGLWVHGLADDLKTTRNPLTPETRTLIVDALRGPRQDFEDVDIDAIEDVEFHTLETVTLIPGLEMTTLRPIRSRGQCDRYANRLRNCASGYVARVKSDACRLFGIEVNGEPVELIEVRPTDGRIVQWKSHANGPAEPTRRRIVERFLSDQRLAVVR